MNDHRTTSSSAPRQAPSDNPATEPAYLPTTPSMKKAEAGIAAAMRNGEPYAVLTADTGCGKTAVAKALSSTLGDDYHCAFVTDAAVDAPAYLRIMIEAFDHTVSIDSIEGQDLTERLNQILARQHNNKQHGVVIVDNAHLLSTDVLQWLCQIGRVSGSDQKLLQVVFVGESSLLRMLRYSRIPDLLDRMPNGYRLKPPARVGAARTSKDTTILAQPWQRVAAIAAIVAIAAGAAGSGWFGGRLRNSNARTVEPITIAPTRATPEAQVHIAVDDRPAQEIEITRTETKPNKIDDDSILVLQVTPSWDESPITEDETAIAVAVEQAPAQPKDITPLATVDDAWILYEQMSDALIDMETATIIPARNPEPKQQPARDWSVLIGSYESNEDALQAVQSALYHLEITAAANELNGYVAIAADRGDEQYVGLLAGFHDDRHARAMADQLDQFGYVCNVTNVELNQ